MFEDALTLRLGAYVPQPRTDAIVGATPPHTQWTAADYESLTDSATHIDTQPEDLLLVIWSESRGEPWAQGGGGNAKGLVQITPPAAKAIGLSDAEWNAIPSLGVSAQMPYVIRVFNAATGGKPRHFQDAGELYQAIAAPATLGPEGVSPSNDRMVYPKGSAGALSNPGLANSDGAITVGSLRAHLQQLTNDPGFRSMLAELRAVSPSVSAPYLGGGYVSGSLPDPKVPKIETPSSSSGGVVLALAALVALGLRRGF